MQRRYIGQDKGLFGFTARAVHKMNYYGNRRRGGFRL